MGSGKDYEINAVFGDSNAGIFISGKRIPQRGEISANDWNGRHIVETKEPNGSYFYAIF